MIRLKVRDHSVALAIASSEGKDGSKTDRIIFFVTVWNQVNDHALCSNAAREKYARADAKEQSKGKKP